MAKWPLNQPRSIETSYPPITNGVAPSLLRLDPFPDLSGSIKRLEGGRLENGIYGHSRFPSGPLEELTEVAERMGITQPAVSKLEKNASKASVTTLERYAAACGASIKIVMG